uniref:Natural killer cell receptor 2B4 immunoglobulin domain-containing protein n=1 Tax=Otus sunia TaxID=257818 RepID=A0A8C8B295_9STRI
MFSTWRGGKCAPSGWQLINSTCSGACLRSLLSALGAPKCREQAVSVRETLWLLPENPPQGWVKVDWRVRLDSGRMLRILTAEKNQSDQLSKSHFSGRAGFQQNNLSLWISAVGTADSGVYRADFEDTSGAVTALCFRVSQNVLHREQGWCNLSLVCAVPGAVNISYSWTCSRDPPGALEPQSWVHLQVHNDDNHTICSCNASNPVSWSVVSTDITAACGAKASGNLSSSLPHPMGSGGLFGFGYSFYSEQEHPSPAPDRCQQSKSSPLPRDLFLPLLCFP